MRIASAFILGIIATIVSAQTSSKNNRKGRFFFVSTLSTTSVLSTTTICYKANTITATCTGRKKRFIEIGRSCWKHKFLVKLCYRFRHERCWYQSHCTCWRWPCATYWSWSGRGWPRPQLWPQGVQGWVEGERGEVPAVLGDFDLLHHLNLLHIDLDPRLPRVHPAFLHLLFMRLRSSSFLIFKFLQNALILNIMHK